MTVERFRETASTSADESLTITDKDSATGMAVDVGDVRLSRPGRFIAGLVLAAALTTPSAFGATPVVLYRDRRSEHLSAESSTAPSDVSPALFEEIRELFDEGSQEFFHDVIQSNFSRTLLKMLMVHGQAAFRAIAEYLFSGDAKPDVISEALRWIADFNDPLTFSQRWTILERMLKNRSSRVRDGAILGFAALDDLRARSLLLEARNLEQIDELRALIDQVIAQLDRPR
jgi:hypothetical protein